MISSSPNLKKTKEALLITVFCLAVIAAVFYPAVFQGDIAYLEDKTGSDSLDLNITRRFLAVQSFRKYGEFPLWEPRIGCGAPLFAESEAGVLHPALLFFFTGNLTLAADLTIFSAVLIAMLGSYLWCRCLGLEPLPSGLSSLVYGLGETFLFQTHALNIIHVTAWLPASLAFIHLGSTTLKKRYWFAVTAIWTMQILASHFEAAAICQLCCWLYIFGMLYNQQTVKTQRAKVLAFALPALLSAMLLGAVQLAATFEFAQQSSRQAPSSLSELRNNSLQPENLPNLIDPFYPLRHEACSSFPRYKVRFFITTTYIGIVPLLLCCHAFFPKRRRSAVSISILICFFFLAALGPDFGIYRLLSSAVPGFKSFRFPIRFGIPMICLTAALTAIGAQNLRELPVWRTKKRLGSCILPAAGLFMIADIILLNSQVQGYLPSSWSSPPASLAACASPQRIYSPYSFWEQLIGINKNPPNGRPRQNIYWKHRSLISPGLAPLWNAEAPDDYVFYGSGIVLKHSAAMQKSMCDLAAYLMRAKPEEVRAIAPRYDDWLRIWGVSHITAPAPLPEGWPETEFSEVKRLSIPEIPNEHVYVYRLARPLRKVRLVPSLQNRMPADTVNLEKISGAGSTDSLYEPDPAHPADIGRVVIAKSTNNTLSLQTSCDQDAHLVISSTYDPNWQAEVDDRPVKVRLTNMALQSLPVPRGTHRVELRYISPAFELGKNISLTALALFIGAALYAALASFRRQSNGSRNSLCQ